MSGLQITKFLNNLLFLLILITAIVSTTSCDLDQKAMVLFVDPSYRASVVGTDRAGFTVPDGLLWREGRLYIADEGGAAFRIWSGPGSVTTLCDASSGVLSPEDIAIDAQGNIFFTDDDAGGIWTTNERGDTSQLAGKNQGLISTEGIVIDPDGNFLVGDGASHTVFSVTPSGEVSVFLGPESGIGKAESMVYDDRGNLYIADNDAGIVYLLTSDKILHRILKDRGDFSPETLWFANGILYITDSDHGKLFKYTPTDDLEAIAVFGGKLSKVHGVTTDAAGAIYVSVQTDLKRKVGYILKIEQDNYRPATPPAAS